MATPRRQLLRSPLATGSSQPLRQQKLRARLTKEQAALARWATRLKRAFHATEKQNALIARLEKQIAKLEESP